MAERPTGLLTQFLAGIELVFTLAGVFMNVVLSGVQITQVLASLLLTTALLLSVAWALVVGLARLVAGSVVVLPLGRIVTIGPLPTDQVRASSRLSACLSSRAPPTFQSRRRFFLAGVASLV